MKTNLTIYVTDEDIDEGIPLQSSHCPVTYAVERALHEIGVYDTVLAQSSGVLIGLDIYTLPRAVSDWITAFDAGDEMGPLEFDLILDLN